MRSDKPEAKAFQDWVTRVVLPAIRKDGCYIKGAVSHTKFPGGYLKLEHVPISIHGVLSFVFSPSV